MSQLLHANYGIGYITYSLRFETNGVSAVSSITSPADTRITLNQTTERKGYVFTGWYLDKALTQIADHVILSRDMTVYAG